MEFDIIERKPSSPIATSLLGASALAMLLAIVLCFMWLAELKGEANSIDDKMRQVKSYSSSSEYAKLKKEVDDEVLPDPKEDDEDSNDDDDDDK